jgi:molybdenum cofactor cytidylyltransferase
MKFGTVPTHEALGHVLAHSVALPRGRLRKGVVLEAADVTALVQSQISEVVVAMLEQGDVDENTAALRLAQALVAGSTGLRCSTAFTGRVNLIAETAGVCVLDVAALHAVNSGDPMITVATVPAHHQLRAGDLVATIKIISYAVPQVALDVALGSARGAVNVAAPVLNAATLIITQIAGGAGEKGRAAIEDRLSALDVDLSEVMVVDHTQTALAQAIEQATTPLVLILTGSATSDIHDVAPAALVEAGGEVIRFGMPVDPGNLLFLGVRGTVCVIGLPGCARSPALNGADWVLARAVCGVGVSAQDIAAMGVGGLLKEIPTRPQPRRPRG